MKTIVLAEKPSVAKEMARVLDCRKQNKGYFEGSRYVITWALGHLVTLAEPENYDKKYKQWRLEDLPMLPEKMKLKVIGKTSFQFRTVSTLMKRGDIGELIIATDAGREGELVARWIMKLAGWRKPFKRLWISSQTDRAILDGFAALKPGRNYDNLYHAAVCRAEADWLIGLNVTRALTCKYESQLTAGRVQTPTLALIIQREEEIKNFVPREYWLVRADFGDYLGHWRDKGGNMRIFDQVRAQAIVEKVEGKTGEIVSVKVEEKSELPPLAYDLTELQRDANKRYGYSASRTLSVLQGLYERHKLVTYPRTDSRYITRDMVPTLPQRLKGMGTGPYASLVKPLLQKKLNPGKGFVNDARVYDHHAIIPTEQPLNTASLTADEKKIYDLIARRFITVLYPPYRYDRVTIITRVEGESFFSRGKMVKEMGWRAVSARPEPAAKNDEEMLPDQKLQLRKKGERQTVKAGKLTKSRTQPPPRYTEGTLLTAMESPGKFIEDEELRESIKQGGLGTPATRAEIIEKLIYNHYIERRGKELVPTSRGTQLVGLVPGELRSPELTARWELRLTHIARGKEDDRKFISDIRKNAITLVRGVKEDTKTFKADDVSDTPCPMCGKFMTIMGDKKGKSLACPDRSCGYKQKEGQQGAGEFWTSQDRGRGRGKGRGKGNASRRLIDKFSDNKKKTSGTSLGDLFEAALDKKK